jgi:hypothetical protein
VAKKLMTADDYVAAIGKLRLSQVKAADFLGFSPRTSRRIVADEAEVPASAAKLLRLMIKHRLSVDDVDKIAA